MEDWYYALNGGQQGPVTREALGQLLAAGTCPPDNLVWREGMSDWAPAHTVPELAVGGFNPGQGGVAPSVLTYGVADSVYHTGRVGFNYAGFWIRFAGYIIDYIVTYVMGLALGSAAGLLIAMMVGRGGNAAVISASLGGVLGLIAGWLYFALMHSSVKQASLGQMACGLRVADMNGNRITFGRATGRYFASILSGLIIGIGFLMMLWSDKKQTLHDQLAGTLVLAK